MAFEHHVGLCTSNGNETSTIYSANGYFFFFLFRLIHSAILFPLSLCSLSFAFAVFRFARRFARLVCFAVRAMSLVAPWIRRSTRSLRVGRIKRGGENTVCCNERAPGKIVIILIWITWKCRMQRRRDGAMVLLFRAICNWWNVKCRHNGCEAFEIPFNAAPGAELSAFSGHKSTVGNEAVPPSPPLDVNALISWFNSIMAWRHDVNRHRKQ